MREGGKGMKGEKEARVYGGKMVKWQSGNTDKQEMATFCSKRVHVPCQECVYMHLRVHVHAVCMCVCLCACSVCVYLSVDLSLCQYISSPARHTNKEDFQHSVKNLSGAGFYSTEIIFLITGRAR